MGRVVTLTPEALKTALAIAGEGVFTTISP
ncbi:MAG: hypothetical protein K0R09_1329, partial [Clostridiales bacterium]|nr:hypothetical protein [Clostridiales bacterium]